VSGDDSQGFGAELRARRRKAGLSQEELAERSGVSVRTIGNLERSRARWPHRGTLHRLAGALDLHGAARAEFLAAAGRRLGLDGGDASADGTGSPEVPGAVATVTGSGVAGSAVAGLGGQALQPAGDVAPAPRQLPAGARHFTGRDT